MRDELANKIKDLILGPLNGDDEELNFRPLNLYTTGILYPQIQNETISNELKSTDQADDNLPSQDKDNIDESENEKEIKDTNYPGKKEMGDDERDEDDELKLATSFSPSSLGMSFIVQDNSEFILECSFGRYNRINDKNNDFSWRRTSIMEEFRCKIENSQLFINDINNNEIILLNDNSFKVKLNIFIRNAGNNNESKKLITISLINDLIVCSNELRKDSNCVFQPQLIVKSKQALFEYFEDFTDYSRLENDSEALNNALLYRDYKVYAMGHGVSVDWKEDEKKQKSYEISTQIMPEEDVNGVKFDIEGDTTILEMKRLAGYGYTTEDYDRKIKNSLNDFVSKYEEWINDNGQKLNEFDLPHENIKKQGFKNLETCKKLHERLKRGIELIFDKKNTKVRKAFIDANKAMFMQRVMGSFATWRREYKNVIPQTDNYEDLPLPDFADLPSNGIQAKEGEFSFHAKWRPFQLAFILSQIESIVDPTSEDRDTTDLIWFPTGGGKTEAYLGLIAFTLFYRRLREENPDNGAGVSVMMRYTLRMLNFDQFQRANVLIAACEMIRYRNEKDYGYTRFSSGIWVGSSLTPNKYNDNHSSTDGYNSNLENYKNNIENGSNDKVKYAPFLLNCPCCGNSLIKIRNYENKTAIGEWGYFRRYRPRDRRDPNGNYIVSCTNKECHFYTEKNNKHDNFQEDRLFPFYTVDEEIYNQRPSLLFGTVDKYAQIAWKRDSAKLFNLDIENENEILYPGPELIIQDELHLIGSSLGTIYGLFEYAIDKLCSLNDVKPKIVGATATAKNAEVQCKRLYNRTHFMQFPPPGISADDSFYMAKNKDDKKPRKYVGFMSSGFTSSSAIIRLASVLMEAPNIFENVTNEELDKYYTLLVYFNSLKELGKFRTFIDDDIYANRKFLTSQVMYKIHQNYSGRDIELSSAMSADEITMALEKLKKFKLKKELNNGDEKIKELRKKGIRGILDWIETTKKKEILSRTWFEKLKIEYNEDYAINNYNFKDFLKKYYEENNTNPIKIATATNMIATGVDIPRLNVMLINGHPKSSSEYIQATSRVGREDAGLIFSFYSATKNRDRSHYENYKSFHQTFYKYVEPASVTPHSQPAMEKIVPSIVIALTWIIHRKSSNRPFSYDDKTNIFIDEIRSEIIQRFENGIEPYFNEIIENIKEKWNALNPRERKFSDFYNYMQDALLTIANGEVIDIRADLAPLAPELIPKVSTMRDVEPSCNVKIKEND